jgi:hypothetical protein
MALKFGLNPKSWGPFSAAGMGVAGYLGAVAATSTLEVLYKESIEQGANIGGTWLESVTGVPAEIGATVLHEAATVGVAAVAAGITALTFRGLTSAVLSCCRGLDCCGNDERRPLMNNDA